MQWEVRQIPDGRWGIFLKQEFCKTDEQVCYAVSLTEKSAKNTVARMNKNAIIDVEGEK